MRGAIVSLNYTYISVLKIKLDVAKASLVLHKVENSGDTTKLSNGVWVWN